MSKQTYIDNQKYHVMVVDKQSTIPLQRGFYQNLKETNSVVKAVRLHKSYQIPSAILELMKGKNQEYMILIESDFFNGLSLDELLFCLYHENGHIELGHLSENESLHKDPTFKGINPVATEEVHADSYAIKLGASKDVLRSVMEKYIYYVSKMKGSTHEESLQCSIKLKQCFVSQMRLEVLK
jgi:hypothetical protein